MAIHKRNLREKASEFLLDHPALYASATYGWAWIVSTASALIFAFGYATFLVPASLIESGQTVRLISGGISGISQNVITFITLFDNNFIEAYKCESLVYSILYFALNLPMVILAWFKIGKRFTIFTLINIAEASLFSFLISTYAQDMVNAVAEFCSDNGGMLSRALFAGVCTGLSSALSYTIRSSAGGIDVVAYYISLRKSTMAGKYSVYINAFTIILFTLLSATKVGWGPECLDIFASVLYAVLYLIMTMIVVDLINIRNKKAQIEVVTAQEDLGRTLVEMVPHAATILNAKGVFSGQDKYVIRMVVSSLEIKKVVATIKKLDPSSFVSVTDLRQVYGSFFTRPIK